MRIRRANAGLTLDNLYGCGWPYRLVSYRWTKSNAAANRAPVNAAGARIRPALNGAAPMTTRTQQHRRRSRAAHDRCCAIGVAQVERSEERLRRPQLPVQCPSNEWSPPSRSAPARSSSSIRACARMSRWSATSDEHRLSHAADVLRVHGFAAVEQARLRASDSRRERTAALVAGRDGQGVLRGRRVREQIILLKSAAACTSYRSCDRSCRKSHISSRCRARTLC